MNMAVDKAYNWTQTIVQLKLGYVNNGGTIDLVHAMISGDDNKIYIAKVDEATKTLTAAGTWALVRRRILTLHLIRRSAVFHVIPRYYHLTLSFSIRTIRYMEQSPQSVLATTTLMPSANSFHSLRFYAMDFSA